MVSCKMQVNAALLLLLVLYTVRLTHAQGVDLTLVPEANGTAVVEACIAKISEAAIFTSDNQLLRRIALVETNDGLDADTYATNDDGGIWQLSQSKYLATKSSSSLQTQIQGISTSFCITWANTQWQDLRKPLYSALAARLYFYLISASIPLANDITGQAYYWANYYTSSGGTAADFANAVNQEGTVTDCHVSALDMFFVMDESGSVGFSDFELMKDFVRAIANSYNIGPNAVRIGVQTYGSGYTFEFYLNTYSTKVDVLNAIDNITFSGGGTDTAGALNAIFNDAFTEANGARPSSEGIPRITIVITDGYSNNYHATVTAAQQLHNAGIIVFAVGIAGADTDELNAIASDPAYVSFLSNFNADLLSNLQVTISNEACVASPEIEIDEKVTSTISTGETKYINYELPAQGLTIKLNVSNGSTAVLYASTVIQTPSEAVHDVKVVSDGWEDAYINSNQLCPNGGDKVYIAVEGQTNGTEVTISVDVGDTSTVPVQVTPLPATISKFGGSNLTLTCNATGRPVPTLSWLRDGNALQTAQGTTITVTTHYRQCCGVCTLNNVVRSVLSINPLKDEHAGVYTCLGSNMLPNGSLTHTSSFTLNVVGIGPPTDIESTITATSVTLQWLPPYDPERVVDYYGTTYHLAQSSINITTPRPPVTISGINKTQVTLGPLLQSSKYIVTVFAVTNAGVGPESEELNVMTTAPDDYAPQDFMCMALNSTAIKCSWSPPDWTKCLILRYEMTHKLFDGFDYYLNYGDIISSKNLPSETNELTIFNLNPYAGYTLALSASTIPTANNGDIASGSGSNINEPYSGFSSEVKVTVSQTSTASITLPEVPVFPVENVSVALRSSKNVTLTWNPPPRYSWRGVIHCNIFITETVLSDSLARRQEPSTTKMVLKVTQLANNRDPSLATEPLQAEQFSINDLEESFLYGFSIQIANDAGIGDSSPPVMQQMPEDVPSGPPINITVSDITSSSITIVWSPPDPREANGVIIGYKVIFTRVDFQDTIEDELGARERSFIKQGLYPYENISFSIAASTAIGQGPFAAQMFFQTSSTVPSIPQSLQHSLTRNTVVQLTWLPPSSPNGKLTSYQVIYTAHGQSSAIDRTLDPISVLVELSDEPQLVISDLIPGLVYEFKVRAKNAAGYGTNASVIVFVPETTTTEPSTVVEHSQVDTSSIIGVVFSVFVLLSIAVVVVVVLVVVCKRRRSKAKIHTLDIQDEEQPTIGNPLYADSDMEVTFMGLHSQSPMTTEGNEYELVGTSAVRGHLDDVEEIKKNPMIDSEEENDDVKGEAEDLEISDT